MKANEAWCIVSHILFPDKDGLSAERIQIFTMAVDF